MAGIRRRSPSAAVALACAVLVAVPASAVEPMAPKATSTLSVLHAIPAERGGMPMDAYVARRKIASGLQPGELATVKVPAGRRLITLRPEGTPVTEAAALSTRALLRDGDNATVVAHLTPNAGEVLSTFQNDTSTVGMGMGRLTVRHVADAAPIDVRAGGRTLLRNLGSGDGKDLGLDAGNYALSFSTSGTKTEVAPRRNAGITNAPGRQDMGTNVIVYVWGSDQIGPLRHVLQGVRLDLN